MDREWFWIGVIAASVLAGWIAGGLFGNAEATAASLACVILGIFGLRKASDD